MFYREEENPAKALAVLTPSESKRLIAKGVKELPEVKGALKKGIIIIIGGTTNAFVAEELLGAPMDKFRFAAGRVAHGALETNEPSKRINPVVLKNGLPVDEHPSIVINEFTSEDVYIKGANAIDANGCAGVLMSSNTGGSLGSAIGILKARGSRLIMPVGLEKLIPSVVLASSKCGIGRIKYAMGEKVGMMAVADALVMTEIEALGVLFPGVKAVHIASGGVAGCEGAVCLVMEGADRDVKKAFDFISSIKGEKAIVG